MHCMFTCHVTPERICPWTPSALRAALVKQGMISVNQTEVHGLESESGACIQPGISTCTHQKDIVQQSEVLVKVNYATVQHLPHDAKLCWYLHLV